MFTRVGNAGNATSAVKELQSFIAELILDKTWPLLALEFKLYALRHPESRERWTPLNTAMWRSTQEVLLHKLFGKLSASQLVEVNAGLAAIGPVVIGLILESQFQPDVLNDERIANSWSDSSRSWSRLLERYH